MNSLGAIQDNPIVVECNAEEHKIWYQKELRLNPVTISYEVMVSYLTPGY